MIKDKEYPATHSMSTSWFAVDNEGNVALFDFGNNGPVPTVVHEDSFEYIIQERFIDHSGKIKRSILTDEQVKSLVSCLRFEPFTKEKDIFLFCSVWHIDPKKQDELFEVFQGYEDKIIILSEKEGYYYIGFFYESEEDKIFKRLCEKILLLSFADLCFEFVDKDSKETTLAKGYEKFPMYIYVQEDWDPALKRLHSPTNHKVKASQLSNEIMEQAMRFPFSFRDVEQFQIPLYYPSAWLGFRCKEGETVESPYYCLPGDDDKTLFILTNELAVPKSSSKDDFYSYIYTYEPTVAIIKNENCDNTYYNLPEPNRYVLQYAFELYYMDRNEYLKELLNFYRPYLLIVLEGALSSLEKHLEIKDKKLILGDDEYPIFMNKEVAERKEEILALASKPYRGTKLPIILDKEK